MDHQDVITQLEEIADIIAEQKEQRSIIKGKLEGKLEQLNALGYSSVQDAIRASKQLKQQIQKRTEDLEQSFQKFTEKYPTLFAANE